MKKFKYVAVRVKGKKKLVQRRYDLSITGSCGLYACVAQTKGGRRWVEMNVERQRVKTKHPGEAEKFWIEGGDLCRAIVAAAVKANLKVEVNGTDMKGYEHE